MLQWGHGLTTVETRSMKHERWWLDLLLQWGHGLTTVETAPDRLNVHIYHVASMGPRSDNRGNTYAPRNLVPAHLASMGPRSDNRGNGARTLCHSFEGLPTGLRAAPKSAADSTSKQGLASESHAEIGSRGELAQLRADPGFWASPDHSHALAQNTSNVAFLLSKTPPAQNSV